MFRKYLLVTIVLVCLPTGLNAQDAQAADETALIKSTIEDSIGWALTKDFDRLTGTFAHDENLFIFHPDSKSTVVGWESFKQLFDFWRDPRFKATGSEVRELRINRSRSGDVAWFSCFLDDMGEWDGRQIGWENVRWTGVLEKRDGKWVVVQMHFSFPKDSE